MSIPRRWKQPIKAAIGQAGRVAWINTRHTKIIAKILAMATYHNIQWINVSWIATLAS
jgi:hypothetical protein